MFHLEDEDYWALTSKDSIFPIEHNELGQLQKFNLNISISPLFAKTHLQDYWALNIRTQKDKGYGDQ